MEESSSDENVVSVKLRKQLEKIKGKAHQVGIRNVTDVATETDFVLRCTLDPHPSKPNNLENPSVAYWRLLAETLASQLDELREENVQLENLINIAKTQLYDVEALNRKLMKRVKFLEKDETSGESGEFL